jgi:SWI/SNF-related matrix-associated actin-dependent regulator of chromatin subfamily A member 2/4
METAAPEIPSGLRELLDKCTEYGAGIQQQLIEEHKAGNLRCDVNEEFFLRPKKLSTSASVSVLPSPPPISLHPHQIDGIRWLMAIFKNSVNGILADDMGLGKTVQVIGFLSALYGQRYFGTHLIVVPLSTLNNWKTEFEKWCPWLPIVVFHGNKDLRSGMRDWLRRRYKNSWKHQSTFAKRSQQGESVESLVKEVGCVVLTTYDMVMMDTAALCKAIPWDILIVDEAHRLKNFNCKLLNCLRKCQTEGRILLTGTPLQNNVKELWSMLNFVVPDLFTDVDAFSEWFQKAELQLVAAPCVSNTTQVAGDNSSESAFTDFAQPRPTPLTDVSLAVQRMHAALRPFFLRRTKAEIVDLKLPPKIEVVIYTPLVAEQIRLYEAMKCSDAFSNNRLMQLRKLCCHPNLFPEDKRREILLHCKTKEGPRKGKKLLDPTTLRAERNISSCHDDSPAARLAALLAGSAKFAMLDKMLRHLLQTAACKKHKILIFSQMTKVLDIIEEYFTLLQEVATATRTTATIPRKMKIKGGGCGTRTAVLPPPEPPVPHFVISSWARLDGSSSLDERISSIEQFNETRKRPREMDGDNNRKRGGHGHGNTPDGNEDDLSVFTSPAQSFKRTETGADLNQLALVSKNCDDHLHITDEEEEEDASCSPSVFLISTRSGGVGLNLVAADTVILFDCDFNPHNDQQAIDRCHRIGQTRPVVVYRLVAPSTVEEALMCVALRKKKMERVVIECGQFLQTVALSDQLTVPEVGLSSSRHIDANLQLSRFLFDESNVELDDFLGDDPPVLDREAARMLTDEPNNTTTSPTSAGGSSDDILLQSLTMRMTFGHGHITEEGGSVGDTDGVRQRRQLRERGLTDEELASVLNREQLLRDLGPPVH